MGLQGGERECVWEKERKILCKNEFMFQIPEFIVFGKFFENLRFYHFRIVFCLKVVRVYKMISEHSTLINIVSIMVVS